MQSKEYMNTFRIKIIGIFLVGLFTTSLHAQDKQNNILFIAVDDLKPLLSNYGHDQMHTPNFNRLAKMGVTFTNAHVQQAVCGPSRASIMTGTNPDMNKVWDLHTDFRKSNPSLVSMPEYLITQGYESTGVGKIYHKGSSSPGHDGKTWSIPHDLPTDWDPKFGEPAFNTYQNPKTKAEYARLEKEFKNSGSKGNKRKYVHSKLKPSTESADVSDEAYQDGVYTQEALKRMRMLAKGDKPFFLAVGYQRPHLPFVAPKKYWDMYDEKDIDLAHQETGENIPRIAYHNFGELRTYTDIPDEVEFGELLDESKQRELIHGYMACISYIDAQLGKLLDELETLNLLGNTNIVLWGDHGFHLGDHTLWCKHSNFEQATRIPLMFAGPGVEKGIKVDHPVELLDVFPTLFDLAGVPKSVQAEGISLVPLLDKDKGSMVEKDYAISQYTRKNRVIGYSIRTDRYRYTEWHDSYTSHHPYEDDNIVDFELYDYKEDPNELQNWTGDENYKEIELALKSKLKSHLVSKQKTDEKFIPKKKSNKKKAKKEKGKKKDKAQKQSKSVGKPMSEMTKEERKAAKKAERKAKRKAEKKKAKKESRKEAKSGKDQNSSSITTAKPAKEELKTIQRKSKTNLPNILFIHADDLGYHDLSCTGSKIYDTPNIDRLAKESIVFTNAYSSYPRCTPSRYGMITATYPVNEDHGHLASIPKESNFIKQFDEANYQTSYVGKWHLGGGDNAPKGFGFDHSVAAGTAGGTGTHFYPFNTAKHSSNPDKTIEDVTEIGEHGEYLADLLTDQTMAFMNNAKDGEPFFAMVAHYAVHTPIEAKKEDRKRNEKEIANFDFGDGPEYIEEGEGRRKMRQDDADYAGMVENLDENVGRMLDMLEKMGIADNTIVVFSSDHGGLSNDGNKRERHLATTNFPLKAGKGHLYEGGIRVPLFIRWPEKLKPRTEDKSIVLGMDIMPTLLDLALNRELENVDGASFKRVLEGKGDWGSRTVFWHSRKARPHSTGDSKCTAVRWMNWKMLHFYEEDRYELYDLSKDISEENDLSEINTNKLTDMIIKMREWKKDYLVESKLNRKKKK